MSVKNRIFSPQYKNVDLKYRGVMGHDRLGDTAFLIILLILILLDKGYTEPVYPVIGPYSLP